MNIAQRWFLIASFLVLASGSAFYCLEYRIVDELGLEGQFLSKVSEAPEPQRSILIREVADDFRMPLISLSKPSLRLNNVSGPIPEDQFPWNQPQLYQFSGIYARPGLTPAEAVVGGFVFPALLIITALYLILGTSRVDPDTDGRTRSGITKKLSAGLVVFGGGVSRLVLALLGAFMVLGGGLYWSMLLGLVLLMAAFAPSRYERKILYRWLVSYW